MKVVCCVCGLHLGDKPSENSPLEIVSHGFCEPCSIRFLAQIGVPLDNYLESIPVPTVAVGDDGVVGAANSSAMALIGKDSSQIAGHFGGDVFECRHAREPGGCGNTLCCSGCVIRRSVEETMESGDPRTDVRACLNHEDTDVELLISTEKKGGIVFLRVDRFEPRIPLNPTA